MAYLSRVKYLPEQVSKPSGTEKSINVHVPDTGFSDPVREEANKLKSRNSGWEGRSRE